MTTGIWRFGTAPLPLCALGPQSWNVLRGATQQLQVMSLSTQQRHNTSEGPLPCWDRVANAEWMLLSPHGRPSVTMAHMGHMAVSTRHPSVPQRRSLPPAIAGGSGVRLPGGGSMDYYLFTASQGAWLKPGLELSNPLAQPSLDHVLTSTFLNPHRSLDRRRLRHRLPRLDGPRPRARCHDRCRRHQPLHRPRTRLERGTLV